MKLPLHDATILYSIFNPMDEFCEFVIVRSDSLLRENSRQDYLVRILIIGIKTVVSLGLEDFTVFYSSGGDVDYAHLEKLEDKQHLKIGGITNNYDVDTKQINWELNFTAEKIFYEEKKINYNEDDLYLNDWKIGSRHIPDIGSWNNISYD